MRSVAIIGAAMSDFGERDEWLQSLLTDVGQDCLRDAAVSPNAVDQLYVANMAGGEFEGSAGIMNAVAHDLGVLPAYAERVDQTSASGAAGVYEAWQSITSGVSDMTLLIGGEKMTHASRDRSTDIISSITHPAEYKHGTTMPMLAALLARRYLDTSEATRKTLANVAVKNHANGVKNPHAQFHEEIDAETVLNSPLVADPLRLYDFCPTTDGSAALLLCPESVAREYTDEYVLISGMGAATGTHLVHQRDSLTRLSAVAHAATNAYNMADTRPSEVDVAELHDMSTVFEILQTEALGLFDQDNGWRAVDEKRTTLDGDLPVNPSGGLKSRGHPLGATGVAQLYELYLQLLKKAGTRQVDADIGLACNIGGFGNCAITSLLEVP